MPAFQVKLVVIFKVIGKALLNVNVEEPKDILLIFELLLDTKPPVKLKFAVINEPLSTLNVTP